MNYLDQLNQVQREAVEHAEGPVMVLAGAGSGKTRVLTYRIAHLVNKGIDPFRILSLTFTNKAAREMKGRIGEFVGENLAKNLWMGTFHSVFARILRFESEKIGYPSNFTIYDTDDSKNLIKAIVKEMNLDDKIYKPSLIYNRISNAKNNLIPASKYMSDPIIRSEDKQSAKPLLGEIYMSYELRCFKAAAMDFDDLLFKTNVLLRDYPDVLYKYQDKFHYILVDEFQDTNFSQYLILKRLAARFENICVVGDDAQSIYAFRGANIQNILNFKKDYPDVATFKLEQNYRSTGNIVKAANSVIEKNKDRLNKDVWTKNEEGHKLGLFRALTDNEEGKYVAQTVFEVSRNEHLKYTDFAILYRTNAQSRSMEEALRKLNIPYRVYGGLSFYQRREIKDLMGYFRLSINHSDEEALKRIINYPARGIGKTTIEKLMVLASEKQISLWEVIKSQDELPTGFNKGTSQRLSEFVTKIESFALQAAIKPAYEVALEIAKSTGILNGLYLDKSPEGVSRYENIQELLNGIKEFTEEADSLNESHLLENFMQDVALLTDQDNDKDDDNNKVILMTIHASKGLEFPHVFIVGMEEELFPSQMALNSRTELEEERRLFYVAITRAEKKVHLSYATSRYRWGKLNYCEPSRFLSEIDEQFLDVNYKIPFSGQKSNGSNSGIPPKPMHVNGANTPFVKRKLQKITPGLGSSASGTAVSTATNPMLQEGMKVEHQRFGKGTIISLEGKSPNQKATVNFGSAGNKQLLLKFAKLTPII